MLKAAILRITAIFRLPATWSQRAHFRAQLRADIEDTAGLLHDIGIMVPEAQAEAARFFWEPVTLTRRQLSSGDAAFAHPMETGLGSDARRRGADFATATQPTSKHIGRNSPSPIWHSASVAGSGVDRSR